MRESRRALQGLEGGVVLTRLSGQIAVFVDPQRHDPAEVAATLAGAMARAFPAHVLPIGVGNVVASVDDLRRSYHEAVQALEMAASLGRPQRVIRHQDVRHLLIYREIGRNPELRALLEESLAPLLSLPADYRRTVSETLAAYLEHGRSPARAGSVLGVHSNTMKYHMKKIGELIDLEQLTGQQYAFYYLAAQLLLQG